MNIKPYFSSKKGFTLIELLVVIGILAVLAAIAIPSIAGLIDRANVSADKTNTNEMTNAVERFTSEYELYCQDIASGALVAGNLDSAQGRVYNVLDGATTREEITEIEKPTTAGPETEGRAIYRDTKYPVNAETMQAIVENYTKTSSSTFEPKQSDMHYWYSPDCGVVVCAPSNADVMEDLNSQVVSGMDAKGNELNDFTVWIDLTEETAPEPPFDWTGIDKETLSNNSWGNIQKVVAAGKIHETEWKVGDVKNVRINGSTKPATLIGIDHDGRNTVTFMLVGAGSYPTKAIDRRAIGGWSNSGGWEATSGREWLNTTVYNSMTDVRDYIIEVEKYTNNVGYGATSVSATYDKLFLLSVIERGMQDDVGNRLGHTYMNIINSEGSTYEFFKSDRNLEGNIWLRSPNAETDNNFFMCSNTNKYIAHSMPKNSADICPAFVIG